MRAVIWMALLCAGTCCAQVDTTWSLLPDGLHRKIPDSEIRMAWVYRKHADQALQWALKNVGLLEREVSDLRSGIQSKDQVISMLDDQLDACYARNQGLTKRVDGLQKDLLAWAGKQAWVTIGKVATFVIVAGTVAVIVLVVRDSL